ncbi:MAG: siphovirus Gp157 family protein [Clostridiales bacterium]|nr:siphovirus Gp157 family protein [Clostridiales bacterium]
MANIYELTSDIQLLWNLMDEGSLEDEAIIDAMMNSQEELSIKLEGYCKWIRNMEADIKAFKDEEARISARRKTMENTVKRAKEAMQMAMETAGEKKMPCGTFTVSLQKNPAKVVMDEQYIENIPPRYIKYAEPEINKAMIKEELTNGVELSFAHLEQDESLRIR